MEKKVIYAIKSLTEDGKKAYKDLVYEKILLEGGNSDIEIFKSAIKCLIENDMIKFLDKGDESYLVLNVLSSVDEEQAINDNHDMNFDISRSSTNVSDDMSNLEKFIDKSYVTFRKNNHDYVTSLDNLDNLPVKSNHNLDNSYERIIALLQDDIVFLRSQLKEKENTINTLSSTLREYGNNIFSNVLKSSNHNEQIPSHNSNHIKIHDRKFEKKN